MNKHVIVSHLNFLFLKDTTQKVLSEKENLEVSVAEEEFTLSEEDLKKLISVNLTDEKSNIKIIDNLRRENLPPQNLEIFINKIKKKDVKFLEKSFKEKHKKELKPSCCDLLKR